MGDEQRARGLARLQDGRRCDVGHPGCEGDQVSETLRLMTVHAHPDDESSKGAATMARYASEGVEVLVVTCTGGERGSILNPKLDRPEIVENIAEIRAAE